MRSISDFNTGWHFSKTEQLPTAFPADWEEVVLPHTWNAVDGQDGGNDYWRGTACYAKAFPRPELDSDGRAYLEFLGAAMTATVFVNGRELARHEGGFSTFRVDITEALQNENVLYVLVNNSENDRVYPQKADFTFYGGLYRGVNLICVSAAHFELDRDGTPGMKVTPTVDLAAQSASVVVETWQTGAEEVTITVDGQQKTVPSTNGHAEAVFDLESVHLWDGIDDPYLYTACACLGNDDAISVRFGCRHFAIDPQKGFILNGRSYPLRGVSRHQDWAGLGNALTLAEHRQDMDIIKEIGANTVRLAHYQHAQEFYDLCDEAGMIVWAEIPYITHHMPGGRQNTLDQMRELITQCYNHPCIICWGLSNEVAVHGVSEDLMENHRLLNDLCHHMDPTRPTTMAHAFMLEHENPLIQIPDIGSYNLYFGWYMGTLEQNDSFFDEYHEKFPNRVMGFSEYGADANMQFQSAHPEQGDYTEGYQCLYHEYILDCIDRHPWLWATHLWNLFDFAADGRDEGGKHGVNQKGLVSMDRKERKDAFYLYKAAWSKEPFVYLCGRRYVDRVESETEIKVYSNQREVSLYCDGRLLETKQGNRVFTFKAALTGTHTITAKSGGLTDSITVQKVSKPNPAYSFGKSGSVSNWFDEEGFQSDCYSVRDTFGVLMSNPQTAPIVGALMNKMIASRGDVAKTANKNPNLQKMMAGMSFQSLIKQAGEAVSKEDAQQLNDALQKIKKG